MTAQSLTGTVVRLLGTYFVTAGTISMASMLAWHLHVTNPDYTHLVWSVLQALILTVIGWFLIRQSQWLAGFLVRSAVGAEVSIAYGSLRSFLFGLVGCVAALEAARRLGAVLVASEPAPFREHLPYELAGFAVVGLVALIGRKRLVRRYDRDWISSAVSERDLRGIALRGMGLWFCLVAVTRVVEWVATSGWGSDWDKSWFPTSFDWDGLVNTFVSGLAGCILLRAGRADEPPRARSSYLAPEIVAILLLLAIVPTVAARLAADAGGWPPLMMDRLEAPATSRAALVVTVLVAAALLHWVRRRRREAASASPDAAG